MILDFVFHLGSGEVIVEYKGAVFLSLALKNNHHYSYLVSFSIYFISWLRRSLAHKLLYTDLEFVALYI